MSKIIVNADELIAVIRDRLKDITEIGSITITFNAIAPFILKKNKYNVEQVLKGDSITLYEGKPQ